MDHRKSRLPFLCALIMSTTAMASGAVISLDDAGTTDPPLDTPFFSFMTDGLGNFDGEFTNTSSPPVDFAFLQLTATFSSAFWNGPMGPFQAGIICNPGNVYEFCTVMIDPAQFTLIFNFNGIDATHPGLLAGHIVGVNASGFQPNSLVGAAPEPAGFALAGIFFVLLFLSVGRQKLLKLRIRT
jgi:hypothetical protein